MPECCCGYHMSIITISGASLFFIHTQNDNFGNSRQYLIFTPITLQCVRGHCVTLVICHLFFDTSLISHRKIYIFLNVILLLSYFSWVIIISLHFLTLMFFSSLYASIFYIQIYKWWKALHQVWHWCRHVIGLNWTEYDTPVWIWRTENVIFERCRNEKVFVNN